MKAIATPWADANRRRHSLTIQASLLALVLAAVGLSTGLAQPALATGVTPLNPQSAGLRADFDGDGISDLAVGIPNEDNGLEEDAGAVNVIYGTANGLTATDNQLWDQNDPDIFGSAEEDDQFGYALATGDFNDDGRTDLAVSAPGETFMGLHAGGVHVLYGSAAGLTATGSQFFSQNDPNIFGDSEDVDYFGQSLAAADFDNDGAADLAIGTPLEDFQADNSGVVHVLYGGSSGLSAAGSQFFSQNDSDIFGDSDEWDAFGSVLAAGDFDDDGAGDLVVGTPYEDFLVDNSGVVHVLYGGSSGLSAVGSQFFSQNDPNIFGGADEYDSFGFSLATGDFDDDGAGDLAVGTPYEDFLADNSGVVHVLYGGSSGLSAAGSQFFSQNDSNIFGDSEEGDYFGYALAAKNFGNGTPADLAIGVPYESFMSTADGGVHVLYGTTNGVGTANSQFWSQNNPALVENAEYYDRFGYSLTAGNFGNGTTADLAVGVPFETTPGGAYAGGVHVIYGTDTGLSGTGDSFWTQYALIGGEESSDNFGLSLAAGG